MSGEHRRAQTEALLAHWGEIVSMHTAGGLAEIDYGLTPVVDDLRQTVQVIVREKIIAPLELFQPKPPRTHPTSPRQSMRRGR